MSESMLHKTATLALNADWLPIGFKSGAESICCMMSGDKKHPPALGISLDYAIKEDGTIDFDDVTNVTTLSWNEWLLLPVRPHDYGVMSVKGLIRVPTVIVHPQFRKQLIKKKRCTKMAIAEREGWKCAYTGVKLTRGIANIDHVIPRSKGGKTSWENCVLSHKDVNSKKGNKSNEEAGLKLLIKPVEPKGAPAYQEVVNKFSIRLHDWNYFLKPFDK